MFRGHNSAIGLVRRLWFGTSTRTPTTSTSPFTTRTFSSSISRPQQEQQQQQRQESTSFKDGMTAFRPFGSPFLKVFLGAIFTYQVLYYAWKKLETNEKKFLKNEEIKALEKEARELAAANAK